VRCACQDRKGSSSLEVKRNSPDSSCSRSRARPNAVWPTVLPMPRNILLVTTDQQRYDSLGCNGGTIARTPTIDALAARGINYRRGSTQNVTRPPARATILTGRLPRAHGAISCGRSLRDDIPSIASHLHDRAGYRTALVGKAHFDPAMDPFGEFAETQLGV